MSPSSRSARYLAFALLGSVLGLPSSLLASDVVAHDPLFSSSEPLAITLTGPFSEIDKQRDKDASYPKGTLSYSHDDQLISIQTAFSPRGNFRLDKQTCSHAQLWLDLKKSQAAGTLFDQQNKLKLVVQCKESDRYSSYLRKEFQAYQMLNLLTDNSFRARWVTVTYEDIETQKTRTEPGFLIEHKKRVADRLNLSLVEEERIDSSELEPAQMTLMALFMFFVGNTDFSFIAGPEGSCCHNTKLFQAESEGPYLPIGYDFDSSGLVNAPYATPPDKLKLRSVRQRKYRGFCVPEEVMQDTLALFSARKSDLLAVAGDPEVLGERNAKKSVDYLEDFYEVIEDPRKLRQNITESCRP